MNTGWHHHITEPWHGTPGWIDCRWSPVWPQSMGVFLLEQAILEPFWSGNKAPRVWGCSFSRFEKHTNGFPKDSYNYACSAAHFLVDNAHAIFYCTLRYTAGRPLGTERKLILPVTLLVEMGTSCLEKTRSFLLHHTLHTVLNPIKLQKIHMPMSCSFLSSRSSTMPKMLRVESSSEWGRSQESHRNLTIFAHPHILIIQHHIHTESHPYMCIWVRK